MKKFFLSLKTTVWILTALVCLLFVGSYLMQRHRGVFGPMNDDIILRWVRQTAIMNIGSTWWFFAVVAGLVILTINTLVCSTEAIGRKWTRADFLLRVSPQIVHVGFLFILLGHLLGAVMGYRISGSMPEGAYAPLPDDLSLRLHRIRVQTDERGFMTEWSADVTMYDNNEPAKTGILGPNQPVFYKGAGVYLKTLEFSQGPTAVLIIAKDPGEVYALTGAVFFFVGMIALLVLKWNAKRREPENSLEAVEAADQ
ncbi:MAG TPA: cytochrome c biogenesis protein ResB [Nitrospirota bacterium]|nr:cytochrome c biogenesis protein ResB [Nitrospirota bacterium]